MTVQSIVLSCKIMIKVTEYGEMQLLDGTVFVR